MSIVYVHSANKNENYMQQIYEYVVIILNCNVMFFTETGSTDKSNGMKEPGSPEELVSVKYY